MKQTGMTLIELMVAMVIGLGITLAISSVLIATENHKRSRPAPMAFMHSTKRCAAQARASRNQRSRPT